jgi:hypothetical protein
MHAMDHGILIHGFTFRVSERPDTVFRSHGVLFVEMRSAGGIYSSIYRIQFSIVLPLFVSCRQHAAMQPGNMDRSWNLTWLMHPDSTIRAQSQCMYEVFFNLLRLLPKRSPRLISF